MTKTTILWVAISSLITISASAQAQPAVADPQAAGQGYAPQKQMPPAYRYRAYPRPAMPERRPRPARPDFPSPDQLSRMTPREPLSEKTIQEFYAKRRADLQERIDEDREAANDYAKEFEKLQKHESESLKRMMERAEERYQAMLKRLDEKEKRALERFKQLNQPAEKPAETAK